MMIRLPLIILALLVATPALAREASFVQPGTGGDGRKTDEIVSATPNNADVGETIIGVTKRITIFFNNNGGRPVVVGGVQITGDGNIRAELIDNDCEKVGTVPGGERCSVGVQVTPNSPGPWAAEILMTHDAPGRVTQAAVFGMTAGEVGNTGQQPGLSLLGSSKEQLVDFGDVDIGFGRAVRTVLLVNDSPNPLTVESLDLVAADRGLALMEGGGCQKGLEIAAGSSCPVTVMWQPMGRGDVSTDLIIRHTGPVGFAVIPVRGRAVGQGGGAVAAAPSAPGKSNSPEDAAANLPVNSVPSVSAAALFAQAAAGGGSNRLILRGTVGQRAILADLNGTVTVAAVGQVIVAEGINHKVISIDPNKVVVEVEGTKSELIMGSGVSTGGSGNSSGNAPRKKPGAATPTGAKTMKASEAVPAAIQPLNSASLYGGS
ncbi:MAG: choice-of-anchor D domain-containing protein [Bdellovibrionales bacterium]